jgi:hypothetical protein
MEQGNEISETLLSIDETFNVIITNFEIIIILLRSLQKSGKISQYNLFVS